MKRVFNLYLALAVFGLSFVLALFSTPICAEPSDKNIVSRTAEIDGVQLHYLTAGHGPPVILLHGYAETSRMWRPIMPVLAERFMVIAPDLPGIGDSAIPADKIDMKTSASRIHALVRSLGVEKARVVGHDIGLMVAYAYATQFPAEVENFVVMDAFLPGVAGWESIYNAPNVWHFVSTANTPKRWSRDGSVLTSNISGMFSPPTNPIQFPKRTVKLTLKPMPNQDACARRGLISLPGRNLPRILRNSRRRS